MSNINPFGLSLYDSFAACKTKQEIHDPENIILVHGLLKGLRGNSIHVYSKDPPSPLTVQERSQAAQLKQDIIGTLTNHFDIKENKVEGIVRWLPCDSVTNLNNIRESLVQIRDNEEAKAILKECLHFKGWQPSETIEERLQIRSAILYSLSWTNDASSIREYSEHLTEASCIMKTFYQLLKNKYTNSLDEQQSNNNEIRAKTSYIVEDIVWPVTKNINMNWTEKEKKTEKAMMYLWMGKAIKEML